MSARTIGILVLLLLGVSSLGATADPGSTDGGSQGTEPSDSGTHIIAVYPNPVPPNDPGEFVVIQYSGETGDRFTITDGETTVEPAVPVPANATRVILSTDPDAVPTGVDGVVVPLSGRLALANDGDEVRLRGMDGVLDEVEYERAPEGELYVWDDGRWRWQPLGATDLAITRFEDVPVTVFVLPDAPNVPIATLDAASRRIRLAGYTFTSKRASQALCRATDRGVTVAMLLESEPVGGLTSRSAGRLDELAACGVRIKVLAGAGKRYTFHHAKYAVADDRAVVLTENWKPSGTGGNDSRGWGVLVRDPAVVDALVTTFAADAGAHDAVDWQRYRAGRTFDPPVGPPPTTRFPATIEPEALHADQVAIVVAPDNAESTFERQLAEANQTIQVIQPTIGDPGHPLLRASVDAARRGVTVQILLGSAWYLSEDNQELAAWLNRRAREEGLPLEVRLATPRSRYGKIHAKGVIVDGETVVVGSPNWTNTSLRENREVALVLSGTDVASYYEEVFRADWHGGRWQLPAGMAGAAIATWALAGVIAHRTIRFVGGSRSDTPSSPQYPYK